MTQQREDNAQEPTHYPPTDDEIDLAELVGVLIRRWKWIIGCIIVATLLGLGYSLIQPSLYAVNSMIQIGEYQTSGNGYTFIQSPQAAAQHLRAAAKAVTNKLDFSPESFEVEPSAQGGIIEIHAESSQRGKAQEFIRKVVDKVQKSHDRLFHVRSQKYLQRIQTIKANLKELRQRVKSYKKRLQLLQDQKSFLKSQIEDSKQRMDKLLQTKTNANLSQAKEPVGLLLFSSEIQRIRSHIDSMKNRLKSGIPEQKQSLQVNIDNVRSNITSKQAELEAQKVALENMGETSVLIEPRASENPVAPDTKLYVALSFVLGAFLGIFLAFLREFWITNRERILNKTG